MRCKKCGSKNLGIVTSGPHNKLVCEDCLAFQKFLSSKDVETFRQLNNPLPEVLKPCPFCGNEASKPLIFHHSEGVSAEWWEIQCNDYRCSCCQSRSTKEEVVKAWNTREEL